MAVEHMRDGSDTTVRTPGVTSLRAEAVVEWSRGYDISTPFLQHVMQSKSAIVNPT